MKGFRPTPILVNAMLSTTLAFPQAGQPKGPLTFHDDNLHYSFSYPGDFRTALASGSSPQPVSGGPPAAPGGLTPEQSRQIIGCTSVPLAAIRGDKKNFDMILVVRLDLSCAKTKLATDDLPDFSRGMMQQSLARHGTALFESSGSFNLAGRAAFYQFAKVDESARAPGQMLYSAAVCSLAGEVAICWQSIGRDLTTVKALLNTPIEFDGHPGQPILPLTATP